MSLNHSPSIVTDGLVLCLDTANKRSYPGTGTAWTDIAGGNNGILENGPTFDSSNAGNIVFLVSEQKNSIFTFPQMAAPNAGPKWRVSF